MLTGDKRRVTAIYSEITRSERALSRTQLHTCLPYELHNGRAGAGNKEARARLKAFTPTPHNEEGEELKRETCGGKLASAFSRGCCICCTYGRTSDPDDSAGRAEANLYCLYCCCWKRTCFSWSLQEKQVRLRPSIWEEAAVSQTLV